jgi:hypothetical protein
MNWVYMLLLCLAEVCNFGLSVPALAPPSRGATGMKSSPSQDICRKRTCGRSKICVVNSNAREICVCAPCSGTTSKKHTVCGNDGQTYSSKCSLQYQRCISRNKTLKQAHRGKCRGSTSAESPAGCSSDDVKRFLSYFRNRLLDDVELMRDGKISDRTFESLSKAEQNVVLQNQFKAGDQEPADGYLTSKETRRFYPLASGKRACLDSLLSSCDIDKNGLYSRAEWKYCLRIKKQ